MKKSHKRVYEWLKENQESFTWGFVPFYKIPFIVQQRTISQMQAEELIEVNGEYVKAVQPQH